MAQVMLQNILIWDSKIFIKIYNLNGKKEFDRFILIISHLGNGYLYAFIGMFILLFDFDVARILLPAAILAFSIDLTLYKILKHNIKRIRPHEMNKEIKALINPLDKFSFPSGHTAAAFLMAINISHFYPLFIIPSFLFSSLIGFSRIYNGVHYPTDVFAGTVLGIISAKIGLAIVS
jgi:undecaprenyl-diphosphatase